MFTLLNFSALFRCIFQKSIDEFTMPSEARTDPLYGVPLGADGLPDIDPDCGTIRPQHADVLDADGNPTGEKHVTLGKPAGTWRGANDGMWECVWSKPGRTSFYFD